MAATRDTDEHARQVQLAAFRALSPEERVAAAFQMSEDARAVAAAGVRARHPDWSDEQVERAVVELLLGKELGQRIRSHASRR